MTDNLFPEHTTAPTITREHTNGFIVKWPITVALTSVHVIYVSHEWIDLFNYTNPGQWQEG